MDEAKRLREEGQERIKKAKEEKEKVFFAIYLFQQISNFRKLLQALLIKVRRLMRRKNKATRKQQRKKSQENQKRNRGRTLGLMGGIKLFSLMIMSLTKMNQKMARNKCT